MARKIKHSCGSIGTIPATNAPNTRSQATRLLLFLSACHVIGGDERALENDEAVA
jgi:hypothetical protein